ncbi:unnamed protein product [Arabis nemorensis]|uniref:DUF659 domain-containing protein n=1 Tax=Arabis nemorensis TaxID=586526 RepID=A0A565C9A9_9BRAS|nr:unnamed protein product [Arabis nemorensis]
MDPPLIVTHLKRNSSDVGWEYGVLFDPKIPDKVKCKLCGKEMYGGIFRIKEHIAHQKGNVSSCLFSTKENQDRCKNALKEAKNKKTMKRKHEEAIRSEINIEDASKDSHTGEYIFKYIDNCIEDIGAGKVVQVVTDNATNNVAAAKLLKKKRPNIFWTGCAAHTLDLMLEGVSKLPWFAKVINQAKSLTIFIYAHHKTLFMMRKYKNNKDIVRPGATRFATCFLTLQSLYDKKAQLKSMFGSDEWHECKHSKCVKGKTASDTVMSYAFWNNALVVLKVFTPLVKVLRLADGEKKTFSGFYLWRDIRS